MNDFFAAKNKVNLIYSFSLKWSSFFDVNQNEEKKKNFTFSTITLSGMVIRSVGWMFCLFCSLNLNKSTWLGQSTLHKLDLFFKLDDQMNQTGALLFLSQNCELKRLAHFVLLFVSYTQNQTKCPLLKCLKHREFNTIAWWSSFLQRLKKKNFFDILLKRKVEATIGPPKWVDNNNFYNNIDKILLNQINWPIMDNQKKDWTLLFKNNVFLSPQHTSMSWPSEYNVNCKNVMWRWAKVVVNGQITFKLSADSVDQRSCLER